MNRWMQCPILDFNNLSHCCFWSVLSLSGSSCLLDSQCHLMGAGFLLSSHIELVVSLGLEDDWATLSLFMIRMLNKHLCTNEVWVQILVIDILYDKMKL